MQEQQTTVPQTDQLVWEAPQLTKADVNSATLAGGVNASDGLGTQS